MSSASRISDLVARALLNFLPRLIPLILFWDLLAAPLGAGLKPLLEAPRTLAEDPLQAIPFALYYASLVLAVLAVATGSPVLYSAALAVLSVYKYHEGLVVSYLSIAGLLAMLILDAARVSYRRGQGTSVKYPSKTALLLGLPLTLLVISLYAGLALFFGWYIYTLLAGMSTLRGVVGLFGGNVVVRIGVVVAAVLVAYVAVSSISETLSIYVSPSKKTAIEWLRSTRDIDVVFSAPLGFLKAIVVASFVAPLVYAVVDRLVLSHLNALLVGAQQAGIFIRFVIAAAVFALSWSLVGRITKAYELGELGLIKGAAAASSTLLAVLYLTGVYCRYAATSDLPYSILNPDLAQLEHVVSSIYVDYYVSFIYVFEAISVLMGFAP